MLVLRGTKKLRDRLKGPAANADYTSSTALGDWFATALFWKPQVVLLVNRRTLLPVFMPLAPASTLVTRVPDAIATALRHQGASDEFIAAEFAAMSDVRIVVYASTPLDRLHEYILAAFGWWNYHLYEFEIDRKSYGIPDPDWDLGPPVKNAHRTVLNNVVDVGDSFKYRYDFGDGWEHKITVEKSIPFAPGMTVPACTDGRRACPPEDCGGPWGYEELLTILGDPTHPEHDERVQCVGEWGGGKLDADAFDPKE